MGLSLAARTAVAAVLVCAPTPILPSDAVAVLSGIPTDFCPSPDTESPTIHRVELGESAIDVSGGPVEVSVRALVTDGGGTGPASGVAAVFVGVGASHPSVERFSPGRDGAVATLSPAGDDWWAGSITVGQWDAYVSPWQVLQAWAWDAAGKYGVLQYSPTGPSPQLAIAPHPTDDQQPYLRALVMDRTVIDVRDRTRRLAVRARVTDAGGAGTAGVSFAGHPLSLASGTPDDGWWTGRVPVRRWSARGYRPVRVVMRDAAYNGTWTSPEGLRARGLPWRYRVRSEPDTAPPSVHRVRVTATQLDTRSDAAMLPVSVRVTDVPAGTTSVEAELRHVDYSSHVEGTLRLHAGTRRDGRWEGTILVPGCALAAGQYHLRVHTQDRVGNRADHLTDHVVEILAPGAEY